MEPISPALLDLARRLLAFEAAQGASADAPDPPADRAARVCDKMRAPVAKLAGLASFCSLLSRALALCKAEHPALAALRVGSDGSLQAVGDPAPDAAVLEKAHAMLVGQLLGLLINFIGEPLTLRLVRDAFPDVAMGGIDLEREDKP